MIFFYFFLFFAKVFAGYSGFSPENALNYYFYSLLAYCPVQSIAEWDCGVLCSKIPPLSGVLSFYGPDSSFFYLGYETNSQETYLVFRNSDFEQVGAEIMNLQNDKGVNFPNCSNDTNCIVLSNPYSKFLSLRSYVYNALNYYEQFTNITSLVLIGYGLGGSLAQLFALDLVINFSGFKQNFFISNLYTYASPAIGNLNFVKYAEQKLSESLNFKFRITYFKDPSPHFPENFSQLVKEIYYDLNYKFTICKDSIGVSAANCSSQHKTNFDIEDVYKYFKQDSRKILQSCLNN